MLDVPPMRGNPFDLRPIERSRAEDLVARNEILIAWREYMHSQSPRMLLLVGERGSGRTSLINTISSQTTRHFVGQYWHDDDPLKRVLSEISVTFGGHEVPQTMHQTIERLIESLDIEDGPLPLIALDYPSNADFTTFLTLISPILQRLRALVVVSLTNAQLASLEEPVRNLYDKPVHLEPLTSEQIQNLADNRVRRMARGERWPINHRLLDSVRASTGGNPRDVIHLLRDLIDEKRGTGAEGTFERLFGWQTPSEPEPAQAAVVETEPEKRFEPPNDPQPPSPAEEDEIEDDWDVEPDDMWEEDQPELEPEPELKPSPGAAMLADQAREHGRDLVGHRQHRFGFGGRHETERRGQLHGHRGLARFAARLVEALPLLAGVEPVGPLADQQCRRRCRPPQLICQVAVASRDARRQLPAVHCEVLGVMPDVELVVRESCGRCFHGRLLGAG